MSYPPPPPLPYQTPPQQFYQPNPRPTSVTVIAIIAIIFGGLGTACGWGGILPYLGGPMASPVTDAFRNHPVLFPWIIFSVIWGWLMAIILLTAGIQSLRLRPIGRKLTLIYAWSTIAMAIPGTIINFCYMMPALQQVQAKNAGNPAVASAVFGGTLGAVGGMILGLAINATVIYFYTRPHVKKAFAGEV